MQRKCLKQKKLNHHQILHIRNILGIKYLAQIDNFEFLDQVNLKRASPI